MDKRRKKALLALIAIIFLAFASGTVITAWKALGDGYEIAGEEVSLVVLLAFISYALAELLFFLREKFENDPSDRDYRIVVLIYLLMLLIFVIFGLFYFGVHREVETVEHLGEGESQFLPPEPEEAKPLPQILIEASEEEIEAESEPIVILEAIEEETADAAPSEQGETMREGEKVLVPSKPEILNLMPRLYEVVPPSAPTFAAEPSAYLYEEYVAPRWEEDDFWSSFYIEGESELELIAGIYYFDLYINSNYSGQITTLVAEDGSISILTEEFRGFVTSLLTDDAMLRIFNGIGEYYQVEEISLRGVECTYDTANYAIYLTFDNIDMPVQIISIRGSSSRYTYRPIAGAETLSPATFTLNTRHTLSASATVTPVTSFLPTLYVSYTASNSFRLWDLYGNFSLYANYNNNSFNMGIGSYTMYYDFPKHALRLSFGNISTDLLSPNGTTVGVRLDKSLSYASSEYRQRSYVEEYLVIEKISDVQILNEGREIFRRTLQPGNYRLQDFILYSGANAIDIIVTPLDGSDVQERHMNVNYNTSLLTPGEVFYGVALATGRNFSSTASNVPVTLSIPYFGGRYLEYNPLNLVASVYLQAGLAEGLSLSGTFAAQNRPSTDSLFVPTLRLSTELTHVNILGTTRYNLSFYENSNSYGALQIPYVYARIGHQVNTGFRPISALNISVGYTSPTNYESHPNRHYLQGSLSLSGTVFGLGWSLNGSSSFNTDDLENATYSVSTSLSYALGRNLFFSASAGISGIYGGESSMYGQVSASLRFGRTSANVNVSNSYYSTGVNTSFGGHTMSANIRTSDLANINAYSLRAAYSYAGDIVNINSSYNAYNLFNLSNINFSISTSSLFADGLFVVSSYIPSNFLLIKQEGVLRGNEVTVGRIGSSASRLLNTSFGTAIYPSVSTSGESLSIFSSAKDNFGSTTSFDINIPASRRTGYVYRITAESMYSLSSVVTRPDGSLWINDSSPVYEYSVREDGSIELDISEYYIFTDQDGRFILNDVLPGVYAFDVPYLGSWILYTFEVEDNLDEYGNMMMYEGTEEFVEDDNLPEQYALRSSIEVYDYMASEEFWDFLYPAIWEEAV